jgi:predicted nuclease of predicted toxin-antitoxin system
VAVATALRTAGVEVEIHDDHFAQNATDAHWLAVVGQRNWVVLTKDDRIRYHPAELQALRQASVAAFILTAKNLTGPEMAAAFVAALPGIHKTLASQSRPFVAAVDRHGRIRLIV